MPTHRYPILIWRDHSGTHTACLVENSESIAAIADSASEAGQQIRDYLQWFLKEEGYLSQPDFLEPQLCAVKVEVRPEYRVDDRIFACRESITLRVPCVTGKDCNGMLLCSIPTLGIRFSYSDAEAFRGLAAHYVQSTLRELTPQALARFLPPAEVALDDVPIRIPVDKSAPPVQRNETEVLSTIAEPLAARSTRTQTSRPWEREELVDQLVALIRHERANVVIVGESGCGKSTILAAAAKRIEREGHATSEQRLLNAIFTHGADDDIAPEAVPAGPGPRRHRFWLTSAARLISGMKYLGQWQERLEQIIAELAGFDGVLCAENALDLVRIGSHDSSDSLAGFIVSYMLSGEVRVVAEATPAELDACRRKLPSFVGACRILVVPNLARGQSINVLHRVADTLAQNTHIDIDPHAVDQVYRLFSRFMPYQSLPGKAAGFVKALFDHVQRSSEKRIAPADALARFVRTTGLPEKLVRDDLPLPYDEVVDSLRASIIGQDTACQAAARVITAFKAGVNDPERPIGVLLFCGPTGVGKTELARAISCFMFGGGEDTDRLVRLDMSEYAGPGAAERLLGSDHGGPSELIKRLRRQPFSVVLLDEIEKAAPEVFDLLLGAFDEGRLTDSFGRLTTFRSALLIMTSNLGAQRSEPIGLLQRQSISYESEAMSFFRPEFFNRIDAVVPFVPLSSDAIRAITAKELAQLSSREGLARANLRLAWTSRLVDHLAQNGFDPRYGARPLQRTIETTVVAPLARHLTANPAIRDTALTLDLDEGRLTICKTRE